MKKVLAAMASYNAEWGKCITGLLSRHGLSLRAARAKTLGVVSHTTISDWCTGLLPKYIEAAYSFLAHFPREEALECLRAGNLPIPYEWEHSIKNTTIDVTGICSLTINAVKTELTDAEIEEVVCAVRQALTQAAS